jgi:hypothetical protein
VPIPGAAESFLPYAFGIGEKLPVAAQEAWVADLLWNDVPHVQGAATELETRRAA